MQSQPLSPQEKKKIENDLRLITSFIDAARYQGLRVIVFGGYGVDGALGEISRYHNDIDLLVFGTSADGKEVLTSVLRDIGFDGYSIKDKGRGEYYHNWVFARGETTLDIYFLQTSISPFGIEKNIVRNDRTVSEQQFGEPVIGMIGGATFEVQDPKVELEDKVHKRDVKGYEKRVEHEQDIENLQSIIS